MSYLDNIDSENILNKLRDLESRIKILESSTITDVEQLSDISSELGVMQSGEFRSGEGEPDNGFTGVRMGYPGFDYDVGGSSQSFNVVGVNNDVLQFGLNSTSGAAIAGGGTVRIDEDGINIEIQNDSSIALNSSGITIIDDDSADAVRLDETGLTIAAFPDGTHSVGLKFQNFVDDSPTSEIFGYSESYDGEVRNNLNLGVYKGIDSVSASGDGIIAIYSLDNVSGKQLSIGISQSGIQLLSTETTSLPLLISGLYLETIPIGCRVYRNSTQAVTASSWQTLNWNTEVYDTDSCWSSGFSSKMYAKHSGYYMAGGGCTCSGATLQLSVRKNGTIYLAQQLSTTQCSVSSGMIYMDANAGDYIEICIYPAANITIVAAGSTSNYANHGWLVKLV